MHYTIGLELKNGTFNILIKLDGDEEYFTLTEAEQLRDLLDHQIKIALSLDRVASIVRE